MSLFTEASLRPYFIQRFWMPFFAVFVAWLISLSSLHEWMDYRVRDQLQTFVAEDYFFPDTLVLDIDDLSLKRLEPAIGVWPYSRDIYAKLLDYLKENGATTVVFDILFSETRDKDEAFAASVKRNGNAVFVAGATVSNLAVTAEDLDRVANISWRTSSATPSYKLRSIVLPKLSVIGDKEVDHHLGVIIVSSDKDGIVRRIPLLYQLNNYLLPALPLRLFYSSLKNPFVEYDSSNNSLVINDVAWPVDDKSMLHLSYPKNSNSILVLPFYEVVEAALGITDIDADGFFKGKTIFIGSTAYLSDRINTPKGPMSGTYLLATASELMKHGLFLKPDRKIWNFLLILLAIAPCLYISIQRNSSLLSMVTIPATSATIIFVISLLLMNYQQQKTDILFAFEILLLGVVTTLFYYEVVFKRENQKLLVENEELLSVSNTDTLTGLFNRRGFLASYANEQERVKRNGADFSSIAIMDLDHFKLVNDNYGHDIGDDVLKIFSSLLVKSLRAIDVPGRWGGEEFVVLMPSTSLENAKIILDRVRMIVAEQIIPTPKGDLQVTVSIGITEIDDLEITAENAIKFADIALYEAKDSGRNKICTYSDNSI